MQPLCRWSFPNSLQKGGHQLEGRLDWLGMGQVAHILDDLKIGWAIDRRQWGGGFDR
ncbi:MAG: hypothetical protein BroJett018_47950 [Chloroflexota bacterium]|nr:hypothetical protein [Chloroflexota bacterium]GIK67001.1 MAG: hypothetical protein BroJett018_47950 [Chloroflexota bacterium]